MQNQKKVFIVSGLLSSIVTYSLSVLLIYYGYSYFGLIYSSIITSIVLLSFFWIRNKQFFLKGSFNISIAKELFKIGLPLLPTFLIYWVYNSMDKIMITTMLGTHELGIYSIGAKVAQISQLVYAAFAGGWQYFAFSTMKDEDQIELNSKVFEYLGTISVLSLILIYPFIQCTFSFLFVGDYIKGYLVAPYLYLSPLLLMLFQVVANQFLVIKKSYFATVSLSIGAVINVVLNYFLIRQLGIEGAAISTLIGYLVTLITVMIVSKRMKCMFYSKRIIIVLLMIPLYFYLQRGIFLSNVYMQITTMTSMAAILCVIFRKEIMIILVKLKRFGN